LDQAPIVFDILASDPDTTGRREAELRRNDQTLLHWTLAGDRFVEPQELAGVGLFDQLKGWTDSLDPPRQEAARLLKWGAILAHGRTIPWERQADASRLPVGNCYTFQPERHSIAKRIGAIRDFSHGPGPLDEHRPASGL
jgi:hypothetical protein